MVKQLLTNDQTTVDKLDKIVNAYLRLNTYGESKEHRNEESWASQSPCEESTVSMVFNSAELALREVNYRN